MRRGRETLLTLLEAFVYEPLVDWRAGGDNGIATYGACQARARCQGSGRRNLEAELTAAMFAVRVAEMREEWSHNQTEFANIFQVLISALGRWIEYIENNKHLQESLQDRHRQLALIKEAQAMGSTHPLYTLRRRYTSVKGCKEVLNKIRTDMQEKIEDCQKQTNSHSLALGFLRGAQLGRWLAELEKNAIQEEHLVFDLVKEFLQNAGQSQTIAQCEQSENELTQLAAKHLVLIRGCLDLLSQYSAICGLYPASHLAGHRSILYRNWATKLLDSADKLEGRLEVFGELKKQIEPIQAGSPKVQQTVAFSFQIQAILVQVGLIYSVMMK